MTQVNPDPGTDRRPRLSPRRLVSETALYGLAGGLGKALALFTVPILSRTLGPGDYGLADLAVGFSALAVTIVMFAGDIPAARLRGLTANTSERQVIVTSWVAASIALAVGGTLILLPLAGVIAREVWAAPAQSQLATLAILLIPLSAIQATLANVLRIEGRAVASAAMAIVDLVAQLALAITLVLLGLGPTGVVVGFILGSTVGLVAAALTAAPHFTRAVRPRLAGQIVAAGLAFLPAATVFIVSEYVVRSEVATILGTTAVGQLAVATRLASVMLLVSAAFSLAWGPHGLVRRPGPETTQVVGAVLELFTVGTVAATVGIAAFGPEIVTLISGSTFSPAAEALPGLTLAAAMSGIFYVLVIAAGIGDRKRAVPVAAFVGGATQIVLTGLLVVPFGLAGVGVSAFAARAVSIVILGIDTRHIVGHRPIVWMSLGAAAPMIGLLELAAHVPEATFAFRLAVLPVLALVLLLMWRRWLAPNLRVLSEGRSGHAPVR
ncbi:MAG: lipopolysaccharide biosynthesis protein [Chloroflexota bacterium]